MVCLIKSFIHSFIFEIYQTICTHIQCIYNSNYNKEQLYSLFCKYGNITKCELLQSQRYEPMKRGYGTIHFSKHEDAHRAFKS